MKIAIYDTETTGLDATKDKVIEVAVVLYDVVHAAPVQTFATLIHSTTNDAESINRIPAGLLALHGMPAEAAWERVSALFCQSDFIVAHNAAFDRRFTPPTIEAIGRWVCTLNDITWPEPSSSKQLTAIALSHGVPIIGAHRALADVDILMRLFQRIAEMGHDVEAMLNNASIPKPLIAAIVSFDDREKAKTAGFTWNAPSKRWEKRLSLEDAKKLPFKIKVIEAC